MLLYQHMQRRQTRRSRIQNHQLLDFGEFIFADQIQELGHALVALILYMRRLFVEVVL